MKRRVLVCLTAALVLGADAPQKATPKGEDGETLLGTWVPMHAEDRLPRPDEKAEPSWRFEKDKITFFYLVAVASTKDLKRGAKATYKLDPAGAPKAIDLAPEVGKPLRGIYQPVGDVLVICVGKPGGERPKEFTAEPDSGQELIVLRRRKTKS